MGIKKIGNIVLIQLSDMDSNIYLNKQTLIDTGTGFNFTRLKDVLKVFKSGLDTIESIINTHYHFDHIGGNGYFEKSKIWVHGDDSEPMEKGDPEITVADFFGGDIHPMEIDRKLKDGDKIPFGDMELEIVHTPGHTPGSICLYEPKEKLMFTGDTIFAQGFGRTDLPGGDTEQLKQSIKKILGYNINKILPGHGDPLDKPNQKIKEMLKTASFDDEDSDIPF